jgi:hypothetical protein
VFAAEFGVGTELSDLETPPVEGELEEVTCTSLLLLGEIACEVSLLRGASDSETKMIPFDASSTIPVTRISIVVGCPFASRTD